MPDSSVASLPPHAVERAVKLSYMQAMLGSIYVASTGGMFLTGYALKLGANNVQIGLLTAIPMLCVVAQLFTSAIVERGTSRRTLTLTAALTNVLGWVLIIMIPYAAAGLSATTRIGLLTAIVSLGAFFAHVQGNARSSWVGDLVPAQMRGKFFGRITMFAGFIAMGFALAEGLFLDYVKNMGIAAFSVLFVFGMLFGLANAALFVPQPDVPLHHQEDRPTFLAMVRGAFANGPLMMLMLFHLFWQVQMIGAPFYPVYMLRDMRMPFFGVGLINAAAQVTVLATSPLWGRIVDRYGCRPVLVACTAALVPISADLDLDDHTAADLHDGDPSELAVRGNRRGRQRGDHDAAVQGDAQCRAERAVRDLLAVRGDGAGAAAGDRRLPARLGQGMGLAAGGPAGDVRGAGGLSAGGGLDGQADREPGSRRTQELLRHLPRHLVGGRVAT